MVGIGDEQCVLLQVADALYGGQQRELESLVSLRQLPEDAVRPRSSDGSEGEAEAFVHEAEPLEEADAQPCDGTVHVKGSLKPMRRSAIPH